MNLLFIDHECHKQTCSVEFFIAQLRQTFKVEELYYARHYRTNAGKVIANYDGAIVFEFPTSRRQFYFPDKLNIFIPMYDNEWASFWQWKRIAWSGMGVISFCDKVSDHARRCGVKNILDVRYFPDPSTLPCEKGDPKRVFLWERGEIGKKAAERLFPPEDGWALDIKAAGDFMPKEAYLNRLAKSSVVIAPRRKEGIGMAFLEAMAMGKCVVAANDATMNEYMRHGKTGILFTPGAERPVDETTVAAVRENLPAASEKFRAQWLADREKINDFIAEQKPCRPSLANKVKLAISYPLFLAEGGWHKIREAFGR